MRTKTRTKEQGIAMVTALMVALIVSITAAVVLSMTTRRLEMSAYRTDHSVATQEVEAGLQYTFARLARDINFQNAVQAKRAVLGAGAIGANDARADYVISCNPAVNPDQQITALHMGGTLTPPAVDGTGGKHVTVRIRFFTAADGLPLAGRQYRVWATADFGTGGA